MNLSEKVNPAHTALVLVDVQNDFYSEGGLAYGNPPPEERDFVPRLASYVEQVRQTAVKLVYIRLVCDDRTFTPAERAMRGRRLRLMIDRLPTEQKAAFWHKRAGQYACKVGTWGAEFVDAVKPMPDDFIVTKSQYSAFVGTNLDLLLRSLDIKALVLCGGASQMCLGTTAMDGFMLGYHIVVLRDLSTGSPDFHEAMLANIDLNFGEVVSSAEVREVWQAGPKRHA